MPRQERIKTLVISSRNDFRTSIVSYLNQAGFAAEKKLLASFDEVTPFGDDQLLWNFIFDIEGLTSEDARKHIRQLGDLINDTRIHPLIYLKQGQEAEAQELAKEFKNCMVFTKPISRQHIVDALVKPFMARHGHMKKVGSKPGSQENALVTETISHVRTTIDSLKAVAANRTNIAEVAAIGQRFNGVYGTFKFFETYPGYGQLVKMAEAIDSVAASYSVEKGRDSIEETHFNLMLESAKAVFELLKVMRDDNTPDPQLLSRCEELHARFQKDQGLKKRNSASQDEVDALLAKLGA